jgi:SAM-dependent methyltransferase
VVFDNSDNLHDSCSESYTGLEAELYDLWLGEPHTQELAFYRHFMHELPGPVLELGCGTGRLLIPYVQEGLPVEGLDCSRAMLEICCKKAQAIGISPILYQDFMQKFDSVQRYMTLYIPACSFMLIADRAEALQALRCFYEHMLPHGQLLVSLFIPWPDTGTAELGAWRISRKKVRPSDNALALCSESLTYQPFEQLRHGIYRYDLYMNGKLVAHELTTHTLRWYSKYEFVMMLEKAGFIVTGIYGDYTFEKAADYHEVFIVRARCS